MDEINNYNKKFDFSDRMYKAAVIAVAVLVIISAFSAYVSYKTWQGDYPREITVNAQGKVYAKPDVAVAQFGVTTEGKTTQAVVKENTEKMNAVIKAVKDSGVEEKDIQTTEYSLTPQYDWTELGRIFKGYTLSQQITVKIRNFDKIGEILDATTAKGANNVGNLQFTIDDLEKIKAEARTKAVEMAKEKAKNLVRETGLSLGKITNIYEDYYSYPQPYALEAKGMGGGAETASVAPDVQAGQLEITATINLTYRIK